MKFTLPTFFLLAFLYSCSKEKTPVIENDIDTQLFEMSVSTDSFSWYYLKDSLLTKSSGSGHAEGYLKTRYNQIATTHLDSNGKVIPNSVFSEGSLIVKELINTPGTINRYAIMWKKSDSPYSDENGWVWGYINSNGQAQVSAKDKGAVCISCHSQQGHINSTLMNHYFQ